MTSTTSLPFGPITTDQPNPDASADEWVTWFWEVFFPAWIERARDPEAIGFYDLLDEDGRPAQVNRRTILAQARLLFTFSHLALLSEEPVFHEAAAIAREAIDAFRKAPGLYCRGRTAHGEGTDDPEDPLATSYDQSFVVLGLSTWGRLHPEEDVTDELEACWHNVQTTLRDPATGMMLEHDGGFDPVAPTSPNRAQNPHMHLFEAALQAFEMTGDKIWLERAAYMRSKGLEYFFDKDSGTITEFLAPDLSTLPGRDGERREIGHQCEWAWLLLREVELGGDPASADIAKRLLEFADSHGFAQDGTMKGAVFDAVGCNADWREDKFLLWPQTEVIKAHAIRANQDGFDQKARALVETIFKAYFHGRAAYANQLDPNGDPIWSDALSRLHYHLVLGLTEGARAKLWPAP